MCAGTWAIWNDKRRIHTLFGAEEDSAPQHRHAQYLGFRIASVPPLGYPSRKAYVEDRLHCINTGRSQQYYPSGIENGILKTTISVEWRFSFLTILMECLQEKKPMPFSPRILTVMVGWLSQSTTRTELLSRCVQLKARKMGSYQHMKSLNSWIFSRIHLSSIGNVQYLQILHWCKN